MGHLYRFVEPVLLLMLKEKGKSYGYDLLGDLTEYAFTDGEIEKAVCIGRCAVWSRTATSRLVGTPESRVPRGGCTNSRAMVNGI